MRTMAERYRFFYENAGYIVGERALCAYRLAKAEARAEKEGLAVEWEDDIESWQGDCEPPAIHACAFVRLSERDYLASLGGIGLNSWRDDYVRVVEAELLSEALAELDARREQDACRIAAEMAERATYASV